MALIEVHHLTKEFRLGQLTTLRRNVANGWARLRGLPLPERARFKALDDVHFDVQAGEVVGIVGTNGAGKSTLLKILSRITVPTSGSIRVRGKIAPLIEVGAGLIGDLTGRENVYLNGIILGMSYRQIRRKIDEIVAFAELENFIDTPIKRYSSGMQVRLGFSIATAVEAEILIVDEVLAVGDLAFQRKCFDRIEDMIKRQGRTVLLVSHNTRQVERLCSRVLLLDHGRIVADGLPGDVCELFYERSDAKIRELSRAAAVTRWANTQISDEVEVTEIELVDHAGLVVDAVSYRQDMCVRVRFTVKTELRKPTFNVGVHTTDFLYVTTHSSANEVDVARVGPGDYEVVCRIRRNPLLPGVYGLRLGITEGLAGRTVFYGENLAHLHVPSSGLDALPEADRHGFFVLDARWAPPASLDGSSSRPVPAVASGK